MEREEVFNLIPAYALDALDPGDRAAIEAVLAADPEARALLADYEAVAQQLVTLAPLRPAPPHLQANLRERLAAERASSIRLTPAVSGRRLWWARRSWLLAAAAALALIVLGAALAVSTWTGDEAVSGARGLYAHLIEQPSSSRYVVAAGEVTEAVKGDLVVSEGGDQAVLCAWDLPAIGDEQVFQIWLVDSDGARTSAGLFRPAHPDDWVYIEIPLDQPISAYQAVGVSLEPAGGSPFPDKPTGPRVLGVPLV